MALTRKRSDQERILENHDIGDGLKMTATVASSDAKSGWLFISVVEPNPRGGYAAMRLEDFLSGAEAKAQSTAGNCKGANKGAVVALAFKHSKAIKDALK